MSSQNLAYTIENVSKTRSDETEPTATEGRRTTLPEELVRQHTPCGARARGRRMAGIRRSEARGGETDTADHERDAQSD